MNRTDAVQHVPQPCCSKKVLYLVVIVLTHWPGSAIIRVLRDSHVAVVQKHPSGGR
jgi:hypothetical protein